MDKAFVQTQFLENIGPKKVKPSGSKKKESAHPTLPAPVTGAPNTRRTQVSASPARKQKAAPAAKAVGTAPQRTTPAGGT